MMGSDNIWNIFPKHIFNEVGGIEFLLKCNYKIEKLPVKLSNFHRQALLAWKLIYKHNFSPTSIYIWNNENILHQKKSLFYQKWFDNGIIYVNQLLNTERQLLRYEECLCKFQFPITLKEYAIVFSAIPSGILQLLRGSTSSNEAQINTSIFIETIDVTKKQCSNKFIRNSLQTTSIPRGQFYWNSMYNDINWNKAWLVGERFCINNKIKEVSFKIMHNIYPTKKILEKFKFNTDLTCVFCQQEEETVQHLFCKCMYVKLFWTDIQQFIRTTIGQDTFSLQDKDIFFYVENNKMDRHTTFFIQLIILLAKFHIHKKKWTESKPNIQHFTHDLQQYTTTIRDIKNKKATRTICTFEKFGLHPH